MEAHQHGTFLALAVAATGWLCFVVRLMAGQWRGVRRVCVGVNEWRGRSAVGAGGRLGRVLLRVVVMVCDAESRVQSPRRAVTVGMSRELLSSLREGGTSYRVVRMRNL